MSCTDSLAAESAIIDSRSAQTRNNRVDDDKNLIISNIF